MSLRVNVRMSKIIRRPVKVGLRSQRRTPIVEPWNVIFLLLRTY